MDCKEENKGTLEPRIIIGRRRDYSHNPEQVYGSLDEENKLTWGEIKAQEEDICQFFIDHMENKEMDLFSIEHRAEEYTTLVYQKNDFLRVKYTPGSKWLSICLSEEDRKTYREDNLFSIQKNKNQAHWKSRINGIDDLDKYIPLVDRACVKYVLSNEVELEPKAQEIYEKLKMMLAECGADSNYIRYNYTKNKIRVVYISWHHEICYRILKKKNQILVARDLVDDTRCFHYEKNGYWIYEFEETGELNALISFVKVFVADAHKDETSKWFMEHWEEI